MKHLHHIIPKHMNGSDHPSNLISLTIEEHAEAHRILYETYGKEEDKIAWLGLSGLISEKDFLRELHQLGRKNADLVIHDRYGVANPGQLEHNKKAASDRLKKMHEEGVFSHLEFHKRPDYQELLDKAKSPQAITKRRETFSKINHQQGASNSQYGTRWITDGITNKKISKNDPIPENWRKGRKLHNKENHVK